MLFMGIRVCPSSGLVLIEVMGVETSGWWDLRRGVVRVIVWKSLVPAMI